MLEPDGVLALGAGRSVVGITNVFRPYPERRGSTSRQRTVARPALRCMC